MARAYNSTIKIKKKECKRCGLPKYIFSKGLCVDCARIERVMRDQEDETEQVIKEEGLQDLIKEADAIFSRWLRMSEADKEGIVECYTCGGKYHWTMAQCGHYITRGALFLRWDTRNTRIQCNFCNVIKMGNYGEYAKRLESERPGITEYLLEESRLVYKPTREEIRGIIKEYSLKIKQIKKHA